MNIQKRTLILFFLIFLLFSCTKKEIKNESTSSENINQNISTTVGVSKEELSKNVAKQELDAIENLANSGSFIESNKQLDVTINKLEKEKKITPDIKKAISDLNLIKASNILNEGNYTYTEKDASKKAQTIISEITNEYTNFVDPVYQNYLLGYSNEIVKNYTDAKKYYDIALSSLSKAVKNNKIKAIIINQQGHLLDLQGKREDAYKRYMDAYKIDSKNPQITINIARYLANSQKYKEAKQFFQYALSTNNSVLKSEIYYSLSSIELNGNTPDIQKSIDYAQRSIQEYPKYPMGYLALARGYYMLNDKKYNPTIEENLKKSILLNPKGYEAYYYLGLYNYDTNMNNAIENLKKSFFAVDTDMILMDGDRAGIKKKVMNTIGFLVIVDKLKKKGDALTISSFQSAFAASYYGNEFMNFQLKRFQKGIFKNLK